MQQGRQNNPPQYVEIRDTGQARTLQANLAKKPNREGYIPSCILDLSLAAVDGTESIPPQSGLNTRFVCLGRLS